MGLSAANEAIELHGGRQQPVSGNWLSQRVAPECRQGNAQ